MLRQPLSTDMTVAEFIAAMAEDSADAKDIIELMMRVKTPNNFTMLMFDLDDMGIRGLQIVSAYMHFAQGQVLALMDGIYKRDPALVEAVNAPANRYPVGMPRAWCGGAMARNGQAPASHAEARRGGETAPPYIGGPAATQRGAGGFVRGAKVRFKC